MKTNIAVDGIFFSMAVSGISHYWMRLLNAVRSFQGSDHQDSINFFIFIDDDILEANLKALTGFQLIWKSANRSFARNMRGCENPNYIFTESIKRSGIEFDLAMSTFHTLSYQHFNLGILHDCIPESLGVWSKDSPFWIYKREYMSHIKACIFASNRSYSETLSFYPHLQRLDEKEFAIIYPIVDKSMLDYYVANDRDKAKFDILSRMISISKKSILIPGGSFLQLHKATEQALEACAEVLVNYQNPVVIVTGRFSDREERARSLAFTRQYQEQKLNLVIQSFTGVEYLFKLYKLVSLVLCPSILEGFGMPVTESLFFGGNVLARANAGMEEAGAGLVRYFSDSEGHFVQSLNSSLSHPHLNGSLKTEIHLRRFSCKEVSKTFVQFIQSIMHQTS